MRKFGIRFFNTSNGAACILEHSAVGYAGCIKCAVHADSASPRIVNSTIADSKTCGVSVYGVGSDGTYIRCNNIGGNQHGVYANSAVPGSLTGHRQAEQSWYQFFGQCIKVDSHALTKERNQ